MGAVADPHDRGRPPRQPKTENSELARDLQKLHTWLQHRDKPTIALRDICHHGPRGMRDRKKAISLAEILVGNGWLIPDRATDTTGMYGESFEGRTDTRLQRS
jgi:hypothetical protein